jgi:hypothetical protein
LILNDAVRHCDERISHAGNACDEESQALVTSDELQLILRVEQSAVAKRETAER